MLLNNKISKEYKLIFANPEDYINKIISIRQIYYGEKMNNKLELNSKSLIANLLTVYEKLDEEYLNIKNTPCQKGCNDCCSDFFHISVIEFFSILRALSIADDKNILKYSKKAKEAIKDIVLPKTDELRIPGFPPCIFVNETNGSCNIYEVRPVLCRMYGYSKELTDCQHVCSSNVFSSDLMKHNKNINIGNDIDFFTIQDGKIEMPGHPIIYWFSKFDESGKLLSQRMRALFNASYCGSRDDFLKILCMQ